MESLASLLGPTSYAYNAYAWPLFVCAAAVLFMGAAIVVRERASPVSLVYLFQILAVSTWFFGFGAAYAAADADIAARWLRLAHIGISFIPAITLQFTWIVIRPPARWRWWLWLTWAGACTFAILSVIAPWYFGEPYRHFWGYYPHYTKYSTLFIPFLAAVFAVTLALYRGATRERHPASTGARRAKLLLIMFAIGLIGAVDFIPAYGVNFYPFGYVPVVISMGLATYITGRYRLLDITPEFAAKQIIETINDGLLVLDDDGVVQVANETFLGIVGLRRDQVIGRRVPRDLRKLLTRGEYASIRAGVPLHNREIEFKRADGAVLILGLSVSVMRASGGETAAYVCVLRDITEQKRSENRIRFLAYYDNLTSLPNRQLFQEQLRAALMNAARKQRMVALLFLDVDHFKRVNDTLGHSLGDNLLQAIAGRLVGCVRKARAGAWEGESTVARLGGDEFIIALHNLERQEDAVRVAERVLAAVCEPVRLDKHEIAVTASLGISLYPHDGDDVEALMKNADAAMYQAKEAGRNNFFFYDRAMNAAMLNRLALEARLRKAVESGGLTLHYQPQIAIHGHGRQSIGVEALLRWNDPELGPLPPERFLPIAEESGLILPIGAWVLRTACAQARAWQDSGLPFTRVAVNLSARQFRDRDLVARVRDALEAARLDPSRLELELTENVVMQDALHTRRTLEALKAMGVHLSIGDFGTGYCSLAYLRSFPIDTLKIDRSFVHDLATDPDTDAIVAAIIAMARSLKLGIVGEGVETKEQSAFLRRHGCKSVQGFLFCEPLPPEALEAWIQARASRFAH